MLRDPDLSPLGRWVLLVALAAATMTFGCPFGSDPIMGSAVKSFFHTSAVYNDTVGRMSESANTSSSPASECLLPRPCSSDTKQYRTYDGTCNNLVLPMVGARGQCHHRLLPATYIDGVSQPPARVDLAKVFNTLQSQPPIDQTPDGFITIFAVSVFQFMVHDMTATAISSLDDSSKDCCSRFNRFRPQCSMAVDTSDIEDYAGAGATCMSFIRAARCPCSDERVRQSMNMQTAYLDLSHVYEDGTFRDKAAPWKLATTTTSRSGRVPPLSSHPPACYSESCFEGEARMNQQQGLSPHQVIWVNLHNSIADALHTINSHWSNDKVFEEARKINIARWQCLISKEVNGVLLEDDVLKEFRIHFDQLSQGTQHDSNILAVTYAESVHAEIRGHRLVRDAIGDQKLVWLNSSSYFSPEFDYLATTLQGQWETGGNPSYKFSSTLAHDVLRKPDETLGLSMLLMNVQRARDVGLADHKTLLEWTYNVTIQSYDDIAKLGIYNEYELGVLRQLYPQVDGIDLIIGAHFERVPDYKLLPLSLQKIRATQHRGHVYGDRLHFSHTGVFSNQDQRAIIMETTFSRILCEALNVTKVPVQPLMYYEKQEMIDCGPLRTFNINPWKDTAQ